MYKFVLGLIIALWLPFFVSAIVGWFMPIELSYKILYTVVVCAILVPIIGAELHANK